MASPFFRGLGTRGLGTGGWALAARRSWLGALGSGLGEPTAQKKPRSARRPLRILFSAIFAVSAVSSLDVVAAQGPAERARTEALARRAADRLQALQREADRLTSDERTLLGDLRKLEIERQIKAEELKRMDADAARVQTELDESSARMTTLQASATAEIPELQQRLVEIYKLGQARYLRLLLSTPDLRRLGQSTRTVAALAKLDRDRVATHATTLEALKKERQALAARGAELTTLRAGVQKAQAAAQRAAQAKTDLIRDIDRRRDLNAQLSGELQAAQQKIQATLRDLAAGAPTADAQLPFRPFRGALDWPMDGSVVRRFGRGSASNGIEIAAVEGASALAVHDGTVAFAGPFSGFGNLVIVDHGSQNFTLYGDLLEIGVKKGARIDHGQPVGTAGPIPSGSDGIYFELRVDGQPVDPLQWLKRR
jgi:septal ring factor EnvC (AmiA/AmiB activator)